MKIGGKVVGASLGLIFGTAPALASDVEFRLVVKCAPGLTQYTSPSSDKFPLCVSPDVIMNDANIIGVKSSHNKYSPVVEFEFDKVGQDKLEKATEEHVGDRLALISRGKLVAAAVIISPLRDRTFELNLSDEGRQSVLSEFQDRKLVK